MADVSIPCVNDGRLGDGGRTPATELCRREGWAASCPGGKPAHDGRARQGPGPPDLGGHRMGTGIGLPDPDGKRRRLHPHPRLHHREHHARRPLDEVIKDFEPPLESSMAWAGCFHCCNAWSLTPLRLASRMPRSSEAHSGWAADIAASSQSILARHASSSAFAEISTAASTSSTVVHGNNSQYSRGSLYCLRRRQESTRLMKNLYKSK